MFKVRRSRVRAAMEKWYADDIIDLLTTMRLLGFQELDAREMIFGKADFSTQNWAVRCLQAKSEKELVMIDG